jgi:hypothetical protein
MNDRRTMEAPTAIALRGISRSTVPPLDARSLGSIAGDAHALVNITGTIEIGRVDGVRSLPPWHRDARIQYCTVCGRPIAPADQLDAFAASTRIPRDQLNICVDCRSTLVRRPAKRDAADPAIPCGESTSKKQIKRQGVFDEEL